MEKGQHIALMVRTDWSRRTRGQECPRHTGCQKFFFESSRMVTGPSFTSSTCIIS
jgi:hypothetical protein